jgi:hypothetical protein
MKYKSGIIIALLLVITLIPFVSSVPPITNVNTQSGYTIYYPQIDYVPANASFTLHIYVSNRSTSQMLLNTDVSCYLRLFNGSGLSTYDSGIMTKTLTNRHTLYITSGNFSDIGQHSFFIWCNSSAFGGEVSGTFFVNYKGEELTTGRAILNLGFLTLLIFFFLITIGGIALIQDNEVRDDYGQLLSTDTLKYFKGTLVALAYALLIAVLFTASNIATAFLTGAMFGKILFAMYKIVMYLGIPFIVIWLIWLFVNIFRDKETQSLINRGVGGEQY